MNLDKKTMRNIQWLIIFTVLVVVICFKINSILSVMKYIITLLSPFLVGAAMAFGINVLMSFLEKLLFENKYLKENKLVRKIKRPVSLILTIVCIFGIICIVSFVVIPQLGSAATKLSNDIQTSVPKFQRWLTDILERYPQILEAAEPYLNANPDWNSIIETITNFLINGGTNLLGGTLSAATQMAGTIVSSVSSFAISLIFACYILIQKENLSRQCKKALCAFLPEKFSLKVLELCSLSHRIFSRFIAGQCLEACILGLMFFVVLSLSGFPYALLISVMIAFLALIPIFGAFIGCVLGAFLILTESPIRALAFICVFLIIQQIEGNLIYPKVVGGSIGLPSIWVLVAVSLGGSLFGIAGMLIFIPMTSVVYTTFKKEVNRRLDPALFRRVVTSVQSEEGASGHAQTAETSKMGPGQQQDTDKHDSKDKNKSSKEENQRRKQKNND